MEFLKTFLRKFLFMAFALSGAIVVIYASDSWRPFVCRYEYEYLTTKAAIWAVNKYTGNDEWCEYYDLDSGYKVVYDDFTNGRSTYWDTQGNITYQETHGDDPEVTTAPPWKWGMKDQDLPNPPPWATNNEQLRELVKMAPRG